MKNTFKIRENTISLAQAIYKHKDLIAKSDKKFGEEIQNIMAEMYCTMEMINYPNLSQRQYDQIYKLTENAFKLKYRILLIKADLGIAIDEIMKHIDGLSKVLSLVLDISKDGEKIKII